MENILQNQNAEVTKLELLPEGASYLEVSKVAKQLGINYVGRKKEVILEDVNNMITKINNGEMEMPQFEEEVNEEEALIENLENGNTPVGRTRTPRVPSKKWYEEPGAFPYKEGDIVQIISGEGRNKGLIGRLLEVKQPSAKKDALKGHLINPVSGELQKTLISMDFERLVLYKRDGQLVEQDQNNQEDNEQEAI